MNKQILPGLEVRESMESQLEPFGLNLGQRYWCCSCLGLLQTRWPGPWRIGQCCEMLLVICAGILLDSPSSHDAYDLTIPTSQGLPESQ